jgi:hypothetical protein
MDIPSRYTFYFSSCLKFVYSNACGSPNNSTTTPLLSKAAVQQDAYNSDDEPFVYPGAEADGDNSDSDESFHYPGADDPEPTASPDQASSAAFVATHAEAPSVAIQRAPDPTPAQLESIYAAAASGDLGLVKKQINSISRLSEVDQFALVNDATKRTGFTPLHAAASKGHFEIVKWRTCFCQLSLLWFLTCSPYLVIEECGAIPDVEDKEGEVSLLLSLHVSHSAFLPRLRCRPHFTKRPCMDIWRSSSTSSPTDATFMPRMRTVGRHFTTHALRCVIARPIYCKRVQTLVQGYLDIVRWLCEHGGAATPIDEALGVDTQSKGGWTPLSAYHFSILLRHVLILPQ